MLLYQPPFLMVGPVTVFPDHVDPDTFYTLVAVPQLAMDAGTPAFQATAILPPANVGPVGTQGVARVLLSFDVHLPLPPDPDGTLAREIQKHWGRAPKRLVPAPLQSGTVTLTIARPDAAVDDPKFFAYSGHPPALIGDNRAALAVAAQGDEAQALVAALSVGHLAGVLGYALEFPGLAPSFNARMTVHWGSIYRAFRERSTTNFIFSASEIDHAVDSLEQSQAIEIHIEELDPAGATAATKALFDQLRKEVVERLFEAPRPSGEVPIEDRIGRGVRDVLSSLMPGVSATLRRLEQSTLADTTIDLHEQKVGIYRIYPQSTLAGLLTRAGDAAARLTYVRLDDLPQRIEEVPVELAAGAQALGVRSVDVQVRVVDPQRTEPLADETVHLEAATPGRHAVRYRRASSAEPDLQCRLDMAMDPQAAPGGRERWSFGWRPVVGHRIWIDPEEWLDAAQVRLEIDDPAVFDVARVDVEVQAVLPDAAQPLRSALLPMTREAPTQAFVVIVPDNRRPAFHLRELFRRTGEPDFVRQTVLDGSAGAGASVHRIMNPFGQAWSMEIRAVADWTGTATLVAEFRVWDVLRRTWLLADHGFGPAATAFTLRLATSLETPRLAQVRVTRVAPDGTPVRGPWRDLAGPVVAITDQVVAERRVRVTLDAPGFARAGVKKAFVDLDYSDQPHGLHEVATLEFERDAAFADWTHRFPDPTRPDYRHRLRARGIDGERYASPWADAAGDDLTTTLPADPWQA